SVHALGILLVSVAWESWPTLSPRIAHSLATGAAALRVASAHSVVLTGWKYLGFGMLLIALAAFLDRRQAPERLRRTHGVLTALALLAVTFAGSAPLLAAILAG